MPAASHSWVVMPKTHQASPLSSCSIPLQGRIPAVVELPPEACSQPLESSAQVVMLDGKGSPCLVQLVGGDHESLAKSTVAGEYMRTVGNQQVPVRGSVISESSAACVQDDPQVVRLTHGTTMCIGPSTTVVQPEMKINQPVFYLHNNNMNVVNKSAQTLEPSLSETLKTNDCLPTTVGQTRQGYIELKNAVLLPASTKASGSGSQILRWIPGEGSRPCLDMLHPHKSV